VQDRKWNEIYRSNANILGLRFPEFLSHTAELGNLDVQIQHTQDRHAKSCKVSECIIYEDWTGNLGFAPKETRLGDTIIGFYGCDILAVMSGDKLIGRAVSLNKVYPSLPASRHSKQFYNPGAILSYTTSPACSSTSCSAGAWSFGNASRRTKILSNQISRNDHDSLQEKVQFMESQRYMLKGRSFMKPRSSEQNRHIFIDLPTLQALTAI